MSNLVSLGMAPLAGQVLNGQFGARLLELTGETTPWQRRLWSLGTVLALRELLEAGPWADAQALSPAALQWYCRDRISWSGTCRMRRATGQGRSLSLRPSAAAGRSRPSTLPMLQQRRG